MAINLKEKAIIDLICTFLESIPSSRGQYKELGPFIENAQEQTVLSLLIFLQLFNSIKLIKEGKTINKWKFRSQSEVSDYFHKSLAQYIKNGDVLINSWERLAEHLSEKSILDFGVNFLYQTEKKRINNTKNNAPIRQILAAKVVIKANVKGYKEPMYLVQLDEKINQYQIIGGRSKTGENALETAKREITEELYRNQFLKEGKYTLKTIRKNLIQSELSPTFGAYTEYDFHFFQLFFDDYDIKLSGGDMWVSQDEIKAGVASDGKLIRGKFTLFDDIENEYGKLKLSTSHTQPEFIKETKAMSIPEDEKNKLSKLIKAGESKNLEFKSSIRWDLMQKKINKDLEKVIIKTISGFLNSNGGTLIIGVADDGEVLGIENDILTMKKKDVDGYMQYIIALISNSLGVQYCSNVDIDFESADNKNSCILTIRKSSNPVFVKTSTNKEFYVRRGNTTKLLDSEETYKYITNSW